MHAAGWAVYWLLGPAIAIYGIWTGDWGLVAVGIVAFGAAVGLESWRRPPRGRG